MAEFYQSGKSHKNAEIHLTNDALNDVIEGDITDIHQETQHIHVKDVEAYGTMCRTGESGNMESQETVGEYEGRKYHYVGGGAWYPFHAYEERETWSAR